MLLQSNLQTNLDGEKINLIKFIDNLALLEMVELRTNAGIECGGQLESH